jgi:tetratricopeptide (TPR) repeat protein
MESRIIDSQLNFPLSDKIAISMQIPFFYADKFLLPTGYSAEYAADRFSQVLASAEVVLSFFGIISLATIAILLRRKIPVFLFAFLWYGITLLPVSNIFGTNPVVADRYAYLPAFAFMFLAAFALTWLGKKYPAYSMAAVTLLVIGLGSITFTRSLDWRSDLTLWQANIKTEPGNAKGYQNLIAEAIISGDLPKAQQIVAEGRLKAPSPSYDYLEGKIYYLRNDPARALRAFEEAVRQDSEHIRSLLNIGNIYQEMGNYDKAGEYYRRTLAARAPDGWGCRDEARKNLTFIRRPASLVDPAVK